MRTMTAAACGGTTENILNLLLIERLQGLLHRDPKRLAIVGRPGTCSEGSRSLPRKRRVCGP